MTEDVQWKPHPRCVAPHRLWSAPDKQATEHEVTAFLAALIRLLKPMLVLETGTYEAHTTIAIAEALTLNQRGRAVTFETDAARATQATQRLAPYRDLVTLLPHAMTANDLPGPVDIAFLDSGMRDRDADMRIVWPALSPGGIVLVHDASPDRPPGQVRPPARFAMFDFATPRGLTAFQKPWTA